MKKLLILILVSIVSSITHAYDYPKSDGYHVDFNKDGSTRLSGGTTTQRMIDSRTWQSTPEYDKTSTWFNRTMSSGQGSLSNGAKVSGSVPVALENSVNKKSVMQGLLKNARKGGTLLGKTTWQGIAFGLVVDKLFDEANKIRFQYNSDLQDFVTTDKYGIFMHFRGKDTQVGGISAEQFSIGIQTYSTKMTSACQSYVPLVAEAHGAASAKITDIRADGRPISQATGNPNITCVIEADNGGIDMVFGTVREVAQRPITQSEFDDIMIPIANPDPSSYVNASRDSQNGPIPSFSPVGHSLSAGASFSTGIYTDPSDGKAKQTNVTVNADGKSVTYTNTMRPDLNGDSESAPIPTPRPETDTDTDPKPETPSASVPLQCDSDKYPDSLGCVDTTEEIEQASMTIPQETVPLDFQVKNYISSSSGTCPQGSTFSVSMFGATQTAEFSFTPACQFAGYLKYAVWAAAWLLAAQIVMGRNQS